MAASVSDCLSETSDRSNEGFEASAWKEETPLQQVWWSWCWPHSTYGDGQGGKSRKGLSIWIDGETVMGTGVGVGLGGGCGYVPIRLTFKAGAGWTWHVGCDGMILG